MTNYRWIICALLFFATTVNYIDRAVLGNRVGVSALSDFAGGGCQSA